jgi:hypothetical protein
MRKFTFAHHLAALGGTLALLAAAEAADGVTRASCSPGADRQRVTLSLTVPESQQVVSVVVSLDYDPALLDLPHGGDAALRQRLSSRAAGAMLTPDNTGNTLRVVVAKAGGLPLGPLADLELDRCSGARAPKSQDLSCRVASCAGSGGPVDGCTCSVILP